MSPRSRRPFCLNCNRIRLTSDGKLRYCLFAIEETDVKGLLRGGAPDEEIAATIRATVHKKWIGHEINTAKFVAPPRPMYAIGGLAAGRSHECERGTHECVRHVPT